MLSVLVYVYCLYCVYCVNTVRTYVPSVFIYNTCYTYVGLYICMIPCIYLYGIDYCSTTINVSIRIDKFVVFGTYHLLCIYVSVSLN